MNDAILRKSFQAQLTSCAGWTARVELEALTLRELEELEDYITTQTYVRIRRDLEGAEKEQRKRRARKPRHV